MKELIVSPVYNAKGNIVGQEFHGELIRCKDCKHHEDEEPGVVYCPNIVGSWVKEDGYCFMAERKEE